MTPSRWHDDAHGRDAGHDEMQAAVFRFLRERPRLINAGAEEEKPYVRHKIEVEYAFEEAGVLFGFADICDIYVKDLERSAYTETYYFVYEIKPRITSVGGLIRQCRATFITALRSGGISSGWGTPSRRAPRVMVIPVVPRDDPKIELLKEMYTGAVWGWDSSVPTSDRSD